MLKLLQREYPEKKFKAVRDGFGWVYEAQDGSEWHAHWVSALASQYDGDDNTFQSQLYIYRPQQSPIYVTSGPTYSGLL